MQTAKFESIRIDEEDKSFSKFYVELSGIVDFCFNLG